MRAVGDGTIEKPSNILLLGIILLSRLLERIMFHVGLGVALWAHKPIHAIALPISRRKDVSRHQMQQRAASPDSFAKPIPLQTNSLPKFVFSEPFFRTFTIRSFLVAIVV